MKIKWDFVTNSSSTSFLIAHNGQLNKDEFLTALGVTQESEFCDIFENLFSRVMKEGVRINNSNFSYWEKQYPGFGRNYLRDEYDIHSELQLNKIEELIKQGKNVTIGKLSSDQGDLIELLFCMESFYGQTENIFIDGIENGW